MKKLLLIICVLFSGSIFAQGISEEDIIGVYHLKSNDPMGGNTLVFSSNHTYAIAYFGGIQKGTWELKNGKLKVTKTVEPQFALYGRKITALDNKTQVKISTRSENRLLVGFNAKNPTFLKRLFNPNSNCYITPYVINQKGPIHQFNLALLEEFPGYRSKGTENQARVFQFKNPKSYNDLIVVNLPSEYTTESNIPITFKDGLLYAGSFSEGMKKKPLQSLNEEDTMYIKKYSSESLLPQKLQYGDEFFPYSENPTPEELKPYKRIAILKNSKERITIEQGSIFTASCENN
ncbi:hypothetical protein [Marixanthomonas ophiurae]|uniref:Uncharacterized protein n=1 Tax=Marixanthomonas ophiurae TaxID=387659 RepID=A0A3E1Q7T8_9FLAO|nr:hypothetical protein [Marixanthomonas ophiurae]RFN58199.1 hypothetical protein DZ858_13280 [Marixanthomonas ophiurae]